jgi:hypothetical protein
MEALTHSFVGGNEKWYSHFENSLVVSYKTIHTVTTRFSNYAPWNIPKDLKLKSTQKPKVL